MNTSSNGTRPHDKLFPSLVHPKGAGSLPNTGNDKADDKLATKGRQIKKEVHIFISFGGSMAWGRDSEIKERLLLCQPLPVAAIASVLVVRSTANLGV